MGGIFPGEQRIRKDGVSVWQENEKEPASNYCLTCKEYMCALCKKFHMKFLAMKDHKTVSMSETESVQILSTLEVENPCPVHCVQQRRNPTILR